MDKLHTMPPIKLSKYRIDISSAHYADGSVCGYYFEIIDKQTFTTVARDGLFTTIDFALDAADKKLNEMASKELLMKFIKAPTSDIFPNDETYINLDNVDSVKIIHCKGADKYQLWFFVNDDSYCFGTFDTKADAKNKLQEIVNAAEDYKNG